LCSHFGTLAIHLLYIRQGVDCLFGPKVGGMLKVTIKQGDNAEIWELEGKLSGDWVKELERCWKERASPNRVRLQIELKTMSYIDTAGKQLLAEMHGRGVEINGCGCMTRAVVEEITRNASAN
jgi:ABC-type transporter Mla MlaB component